jgi:hypothetical protein
MKIFTECLDHYGYIHGIIRVNETCSYIFSESHLYTHPPLLSLLHFPICTSHLKNTVTHLQKVKAENATSLSVMRAFQTSFPTQTSIHSLPQAAAVPLSFRSKVTECTTCILLSTAHEVSCPVSAGHFYLGTKVAGL